MKVTLSWLNEYVPIEMGVDDLSDALTMIGLEVESITDRFEYMKNVKVGRVIDIQPHPATDRLKICVVDAGKGLLRIICGAPNVKKGMLAPIALPGTLFPDGTNLDKSIIRGVLSEGMICSEKELGLGLDQSGAMILGSSHRTGENLANALELSDTILEISVTPNRPDCLSLLGIAREIAGIQKTTLRYPDTRIVDKFNDLSGMSSVRIEAADYCPRYSARVLSDVKMGPSPFWLQDRLISVGSRPINNIVDVTNYVLMETGQPLHAFDFDKLSENRIVVRTAMKGETFTTLDQKERIMPPDALMICDGQKPVALAGIMGGLNSEITETTSRVFIESAYFDPVSIRRTSKALGLSTEASYRFERGVDPSGTVSALDRAAVLMSGVSSGKIVKGYIDETPKAIPQKKVILSVSKTKRLLGSDYSQDDISKLLSSIEFKSLKLDQDRIEVVSPMFRVDIDRPEDLMEEVARLSGYQRIPTTFPSMPAGIRKSNNMVEVRNRIKTVMVGLGFLEVINYSFIHESSQDRLMLPDNDPRRKKVPILNPLSEEQTCMRTSLVPGLLGTLQRNLYQQIRTLRLFEAGKIYIGQGGDRLPVEKEMLTVLRTGARFNPSWHGKETPCDFYDLKGVVESLLESQHVMGVVFTRMPKEICHYTRPGYTAQIRIKDVPVGLAGEVHPEVLKAFDVRQPVFIAELCLDDLMLHLPDTKQSVPISRYPAVLRDFTIIVDKEIEAWNILHCANDAQEEFVENIQLFDVFYGKPIPAGKKSISFRITYRSMNKTLEDKEVNQIHQRISNLLLKSFNASLPE